MLKFLSVFSSSFRSSSVVEELGLAVLAATLPLPCCFHPLDLVLPKAGSPLMLIRVPNVFGLTILLCVLALLRRMLHSYKQT